MTNVARWYVYTLTDPRDGAAFYVGKGCGNRLAQHERDAAKSEVRSKKLDRIREIWAGGHHVQRAQVAYFWDEQDAYDHETDLIDEIGLENLTNVLPGGQKAWERRRQERQSRRAQDWTPMEAAQLLAKKNAWSGLALWMRLEAGQAFTMKGPKLVIAVWRAAFEALFPLLWKRIERSTDAIEFCRPHLKRYGVELVYGRE